MKETYIKIGNDYKQWSRKADTLRLAHDILYKRHYDAYLKITSTNKKVLEGIKSGILPKKPMIQYHEDMDIKDEHNYQLLHGPSLVMLGFSIECFLKALWLKNGGKIIDDNGNFRGVINEGNKIEKWHNLTYFSKMCRFELNEQEENCLVRLGKFMTSIGRYPISRSLDDHELTEDKKVKNFYWGSLDEEIIRKIIYRIKCLLDERPGK